MWTRELLKTNAKNVLSHRYWRAFLVCLVAGILTGSVSTRVSLELNFGDLRGIGGLLLSVFGIVLGISALVWSIFCSNVLIVGWKRFMMESRVGNSPFDTLFSAFSSGYGNVVKAMFLRNLYLFLYGLLLVVPGIIKSYEYCMVPYLLAENPRMEPRRAMELSGLMTDGEKWNIFVLELSFFGWNLLNVITAGFASLFIAPYYEATFAELYAALRAKAFALGYTSSEELGDFIRY